MELKRLNPDGSTDALTGAKIAIGGGDSRTIAAALADKMAVSKTGATPFALVRFTADVGGVIPLPTALGALYAPGANEVARFGVLPVSCGGTGRATPAGAREAIGMENGIINVTVPASGSKDTNVPFNAAFSANPTMLVTNMTTGTTGYVRVSASATTTSAIVRIINEKTSEITMYVGWAAIGSR